MRKWLLVTLFSLALAGCAPPDDGDGSDNGGDANVTSTQIGADASLVG